MKKLHFLIPLAGMASLLACLVTIALTRKGEPSEAPRAHRGSSEEIAAWPPLTWAAPAAARSSAAVRTRGAEPSRTLPPAPAPPKATLGSHGTLGYLRDIPPCSGEAGRKEVIRRTAEHLGVQEVSRADFEKAAHQALLEMHEASRLHQEEAQALGITRSGPRKAIPSEASRRLRDLYAARRLAALGHLEPYLPPSLAGEQFRTSFDAWVATIGLKGQEPR